MRKASKLLLSTALLATFAGGVVVPVVGTLGGPTIVWAEGDTPTDKTQIPAETILSIHKLGGKTFEDPIENKDGKELSLDDINKLLDPTNKKDIQFLNGVKFVAFKITKTPTNKEEALAKLKTAKTIDQLKSLAQENEVTLSETPIEIGTTAGQGLVDWNVKKVDYGDYIVIEDETAVPENVSSAVAVPFIASFPMALSDGSGYLSQVHVYPKNIQGNFPKPGKDVQKLGNNNGSYKIGDEISFILKGSIPVNIQDYEAYDLVDDFDSQLTPDKDSIVVSYGSHTLTNTDATKYYTVNQEGNKITVSLTEKGIEQIAHDVAVAQRDQANIDGEGGAAETAVNEDTAPFIQVKITAKINDKAVLSKDINNKTTIEFDNKKDNKKVKNEKPQHSKDVKVFTGGRKFKKIEFGDADKKGLAGAEFTLYEDSKGKTAVTWTPELIAANLAGADGANADKFIDVADKAPIKLKSADDGTFAIAGLAYAKVVTEDGVIIEKSASEAEGRHYYLKETKAPEGYVVKTELVDFEINGATSSGKAIEITATEDTTLDVNNSKRPSIPQTGGIGSALFILAGLGSMIFAGLGLKKRKNQA